MTNPSYSLSTPPSFQCYECIGCGECCRGRFAIAISTADRERIEAQQWSDEELSLAGKALFTPYGNGAFKLAHSDTGACIFLAADGKCRIHAKYGEAAKPFACRLYPFRFIPIGAQIRIDIRYDCPAVAQNRGRPISGFRPYLLKLLPLALTSAHTVTRVPAFFGKVNGSWAQYCRITECFERLLLQRQFSLSRRIISCIYLTVALHDERIIQQQGRKFSEFLDKISTKISENIADDHLTRQAPSSITRSAFRQLAASYGRLDMVGDQANMLQRLAASLQPVLGRGLLPRCREDFPKVSYAQMEEEFNQITGEASEVFERYLHMHLTSMSYFGSGYYNRSLLDGISALWLLYPLLSWYSRSYALGSGNAAHDGKSAARAVEIVDHQHGISPLLNLPSERSRTKFLTERSQLRSLVLWYGG